MDIKRLIEKNNITIKKEHIDRLSAYVEILLRENKKYNLASIKDLDVFLEKTLVDSLIIQRSKKIKIKGSLIDIGSGNGFPGIVLAICYPELKVTLLDAEKKKVQFLEMVRDELDLDLEVLHLRAEDHIRQKIGYFDLVCAKALVSKPDKWLRWTVPFAKRGGFIINYKTAKFLEELKLSSSQKFLKKYNTDIIEKIDYKVSDSERIIVIMKKKKARKTNK